jgi:nucleotide-binding universal stress UspA family protein
MKRSLLFDADDWRPERAAARSAADRYVDPDTARDRIGEHVLRAPRVMVGVDGSAAGDAALLWAASEARVRRAELLVVHICDDHLLRAAPYASVFCRPDAERALADGQAIVGDAAARIAETHPDVPVRSRLLRGRPAEALLGLAKGADLLVLGSAAHHAGDGHLGAVLLTCLRWPSCPVVVVPPQCSTVSADRPRALVSSA